MFHWYTYKLSSNVYKSGWFKYFNKEKWMKGYATNCLWNFLWYTFIYLFFCRDAHMDWGCASRQHTSTPNKAWKIKIPSTQLFCVDEESGVNAMDLVDNTIQRLERTYFLLRRLNKWIGALESFIMTLVTVYHC